MQKPIYCQYVFSHECAKLLLNWEGREKNQQESIWRLVISSHHGRYCSFFPGVKQWSWCKNSVHLPILKLIIKTTYSPSNSILFGSLSEEQKHRHCNWHVNNTVNGFSSCRADKDVIEIPCLRGKAKEARQLVQLVLLKINKNRKINRNNFSKKLETSPHMEGSGSIDSGNSVTESNGTCHSSWVLAKRKQEGCF